jgi:hypothetical protein
VVKAVVLGLRHQLGPKYLLHSLLCSHAGGAGPVGLGSGLWTLPFTQSPGDPKLLSLDRTKHL